MTTSKDRGLELLNRPNAKPLTWSETIGAAAVLLYLVAMFPRILLSYALNYKSLSEVGMSLEQYIFAAVNRFLFIHLTEEQVVVLHTAVNKKTMRNILETQLSSDITYLEPITGQPFKGIWLVKDNTLSLPEAKVLVWFHGGGYVFGEPLMFFPVMLDLYKKLQEIFYPISIFFLEYTLAPEGKYPTQLREAVQAYQYLLQDLNIDPANIIVGGDSAGGNLTLQLFRHINTPHPEIPIVIPASAKPSKCILSSPWLCMDHKAPSYISNAKYDLMTVTNLSRSASRWKGNISDDFTDPLKASYEGWSSILSPTMVLSGRLELFKDDIQEFCENLKKSGCSVVEDHRRGRMHDWWWSDGFMYGLANPKSYEANNAMRDFIAT